jgi:hypothetical protein
MTRGPLQIMILTFPPDRLASGIGATLDRIVDSDDLDVVDAVIVRTDPDGHVHAMRLAELPGLRGLPASWDTDGSGLIAEADLEGIAETAGGGNDAVAVLVEHRWTADIAGRAACLNGSLVTSAHVPARPAAEGTGDR